MVSCTNFVNDLECVMHYQNEYNVKLIILLFMFGYILFSLWYIKEENVMDSIYNMFKYISFNVFPKILLVFFPFFLLTLVNDVSLELVITTLTVVYFIILGLFIGISLFYSKEKITEILGDRRDFKSKFKYIKR